MSATQNAASKGVQELPRTRTIEQPLMDNPTPDSLMRQSYSIVTTNWTELCGAPGT
jgi:hypothetical protein